MRRILLTLGTTLSLSVLAACASSGTTAEGTTATGTAASSTTASILTRTEIASADLPTAYDVVDRLRRPWFRRDVRSGNEVSVVLDNVNLGGIETLRNIPSADIGEMRLVPSAEATRRWPNLGVGGNVILVIRR